MLDDATTFNLMKYAPFHFKPVRHHCQMQIIHQTQKRIHCCAGSYLACFCDIVQNHFNKKKTDEYGETIANYVISLNWYNAAQIMHVLV